jgi:hypothetical protein
MFSAIPRSSTGNDLSPLSDKAPQRPYVFVIDCKGFVGAETANLAPSAGPPASAGSAFAFATATLAARLVRLWG